MNDCLKTQITSRGFCFIFFIFILTFISCGDESNDNGNGDGLVRAPVIYMWVSEATKKGDIGLSGADNICQREGAGMTFPTRVISHKALLSGPRRDARDLFDSEMPVKRPDGTEIIDSYANFFVESESLINTIGTGSDEYWTGVFDHGRPSTLTDSCHDWTSASSSYSAFTGGENHKDYSRLKYSTRGGCSFDFHILCVSN